MLDTKLPQFLTCLSMDVAEQKILLPNTAVAELVPYRNVSSIEHAPEWVVGQFDWRGVRLPVVSYAALTQQQELLDEQSRIVILNAISEREDFRFYAIIIQGIPRSVRVDASLSVDSTAELGEYQLQAVRQHGHRLYIPDLKALEALIINTVL